MAGPLKSSKALRNWRVGARISGLVVELPSSEKKRHRLFGARNFCKVLRACYDAGKLAVIGGGGGGVSISDSEILG